MKVFLKIILIVISMAAFAALIAFLAERLEEIRGKDGKFRHKPYGIYERFFKRPLDCFLSTGALIVLSPVMVILTVLGAVYMKGNPFFTQDRPGRIDPITGKSRIFKLIKFRSMTNEKDENGNLLPDDQRLPKYGKLLRASSLDELGELFNIIKGDMAVVGPRPLLVKYIDHYNAHDMRRHEVRPGLTGLAQVSGRNSLSWGEKFRKDVEYVDNLSFSMDLRVILMTVQKVFKRDGIEFVKGHQPVMDYFNEQKQKQDETASFDSSAD